MAETRSYHKKVASITVDNGGSGYATAPDVIISGNATATATVVDGAVSEITVTFAGNGYLSPPLITFSGGGGSGAAATANMVYIDDEYNGFKQSLSHLIANQLPDFVRNEYPVFVSFLEKYYEFLDQEGQVNNFLLNYERNFDINRTLDSFLPKFKNQYAQNFAVNSPVDDRRLIKFIKQFYEAKGSEKAIELLFKILFNEQTEIFYPSEQILRASDGIWVEDVTLKLAVDSSITANPFELNGKTVRIVYYENVGSVVFEREVETNITNVTKFAYIFPPVYELVTSLPKNSQIRVPGAGAVANTLIFDGQVKAVVGDGFNEFDVTTDVNYTTNTITINSHGYTTGDIVIYQKHTGHVIGGLTDYSIYYVIVTSPTTIKLATSLNNATSGVAIDLTANDIGPNRLYEPLTDGGNGYFAAPTVQFSSDGGNGATARAVLTDDFKISHVIITSGGSGYTSSPEVTFSTDSIRTKIFIGSDAYGYVVRQLSTVSVVSCDGTPPCGFVVGDIYSIDETSSVGPYTIEQENDALEYFLNKVNETDTVINPYTLVGRDNRASIRIDAVDEDGCPTAVSIFDTGFDFERETFTATIVSPNGCSVTLSFTTGGVNVKTGRFRDSRGMLSNVNKLQDNFYYQNYSYVIRSNVPSNKWIDVVKQTAHPAGTAIFGELIIEQVVDYSEFITTPIQPLHIYEFVLDELFTDTFAFEIDFIKVLEDSATISDSSENHFYKVLLDGISTIDEISLEFDVGIYNEEDDNASPVDVFDRVVQYVRDFSDTTITAENAITDFNKILEDTLYLSTPYAIDYFDEDYVSADRATFDFSKLLSDIATTSESTSASISKPLSETATPIDSFGRSVQYYREFADSVITGSQTSLVVLHPGGDEHTSEVIETTDNSSNHFFKTLVDSVTSTDTAGVIPYLVKTDDAGTTELLIVSNDAETIDSIAATEQSLINTLKGLFETVTVTEDGIINTQDYVDGDFGSDYVGQVAYFN